VAIDPIAKLAANERARLRNLEASRKRAKAKKRSRRTSPFAQSEKKIIDGIALDNPNDQQIEALAIAMRRPVETVAVAVESSIAAARRKLQDRAEEYVDLHMEASRLAIAMGEVGEARKAAEWGMTNISGKTSAGDSERIVEKVTTDSDAPRIQIGINLGGLPASIARRDNDGQ
jgi:hypothetical protein